MNDALYDLGNGHRANKQQQKALNEMVKFLHSTNEEYTLGGKAGTGKTTIIKKIVDYYNSFNRGSRFFSSNDVVGATISHAAKNVLRRAFSDSAVQTVTVAKLLGMKQQINEKGHVEFLPDPKTWKVAPPPIKSAKLLIIDECSMISKKLLSLIREHKLDGTKVIFMGRYMLI